MGQRSPSHWLLLCILMLAGHLAGCTVFSGRTSKSTNQGLSTISEGYTLLYEVTSQQKHIDKLLLIKIESDGVDVLISEISAYMAKLEDQLIKLAKEDPSLDLDRKVLPEMASKMHQSVQAEQLKVFLGATGKDFERELLLGISSTLNQARHLAKVMRAAETSEQRKAFWKDVQEHFDDQYRRVVELLEGQYYS
jgi:hypothetical protein